MLDFWKNKNVLITGHTGFKGSWLCYVLNELGANVSGYSLEPDQDCSLFSILGRSLHVHSQYGDIRDLNKLKKFVSTSKPDIIFHMAAQPLVRDSYENPVNNFSTNVMGTVNILEAYRFCETARALINVTTDKCYKNNEWIWGYREDDVLGGHDPYSNSKACSELVTESYKKSFFVNNTGDIEKGIATARAGNVIGGGDWAKDRIIPDFFRSIEKKKPLFVRNKHAVRPWQHVLDPLSGYLNLAERLYSNPKQYSQAWNFGPEDSGCISVEKLLNLMQKYSPATRWESTNNEELHEATLLKLDISKAKSILRWSPRLDISRAVEYTADWYTTYINRGPVISLMESQISPFFKLREKELL